MTHRGCEAQRAAQTGKGLSPPPARATPTASVWKESSPLRAGGRPGRVPTCCSSKPNRLRGRFRGGRLSIPSPTSLLPTSAPTGTPPLPSCWAPPHPCRHSPSPGGSQGFRPSIRFKGAAINLVVQQGARRRRRFLLVAVVLFYYALLMKKEH